MVEATRLPTGITSKTEFYDLICMQLTALLEGERSWITNLSNASALLFWAYRDSELWGAGKGAVNWCGFYLDSTLFPPSPSTPASKASQKPDQPTTLKLGPFQGRPACLLIPARPGGGVCADSFLQLSPLVVEDVHQYPGHIACDGETNSEVVVPLLLRGAGAGGEGESGAGGEGKGGKGRGRALGVLDLDCLRVGGFDRDDVAGLERVVRIVMGACDWPEVGAR